MIQGEIVTKISSMIEITDLMGGGTGKKDQIITKVKITSLKEVDIIKIRDLTQETFLTNRNLNLTILIPMGHNRIQMI